MFELFEEFDGAYNFKSLEMFRDSVLVACCKVILGKKFAIDEVPDNIKDFLTLQEVEAVLRDQGIYEDAGVFAIGGDSKEEAAARILKIVNALSMRVISNAMAFGVKRDLLDCTFDPESNDFEFAITEKGKKLANQLDQKDDDEDTDRSDI